MAALEGAHEKGADIAQVFVDNVSLIHHNYFQNIKKVLLSGSKTQIPLVV